jgi:hypothetical protein
MPKDWAMYAADLLVNVLQPQEKIGCTHAHDVLSDSHTDLGKKQTR